MALAETAVIILAGGKGSRMQASAPKQFLQIKGKPLMCYAIETFAATLPESPIYLVLPEDGVLYFEEKVFPFLSASIKPQVKTVIGGSSRFESVQQGLAAVNPNTKWVSIHDAARPFLSKNLILKGLKLAQKYDGAVPTLPLSDSIMEKKQQLWEHQNRTNFRLIQTPQNFSFGKIHTAYSRPFQEKFTDCASVFADAGFSFEVFPGEKQNFKVTTPFDLALARFWSQNIEG